MARRAAIQLVAVTPKAATLRATNQRVDTATSNAAKQNEEQSDPQASGDGDERTRGTDRLELPHRVQKPHRREHDEREQWMHRGAKVVAAAIGHVSEDTRCVGAEEDVAGLLVARDRIKGS